MNAFEVGDLVLPHPDLARRRLGIIVTLPWSFPTFAPFCYGVQYIDEQGLREGLRNIHLTQLKKVES